MESIGRGKHTTKPAWMSKVGNSAVGLHDQNENTVLARPNKHANFSTPHVTFSQNRDNEQSNSNNFKQNSKISIDVAASHGRGKRMTKPAWMIQHELSNGRSYEAVNDPDEFSGGGHQNNIRFISRMDMKKAADLNRVSNFQLQYPFYCEKS